LLQRLIYGDSLTQYYQNLGAKDELFFYNFVKFKHFFAKIQ